jgi:hypothetical protein
VSRPRVLVVYASSRVNETLSYQQGWPRAFAQDARFDTVALNLLASPRLRKPGRRSWEAVVLLHSVFSNTQVLQGRALERIAGIDAPKVWFIGNEYKLMPEKMRFADELDIALLVSQTMSDRVHELYRERLGCTVVGIPNAGLDPEMFAPTREPEERPIDIGYRAYPGALYLGHDERQRLGDAFVEAAPRHGLDVDISLAAGQRFTEPEWAEFLNSCRGQLGFEAGTDYFELDDDLRLRINAYVTENPEATLVDVRSRFLAHYDDPVPLRVLSSRIVEAAGTRTTQLLIDGDYAGFFEPDVHYIPLRQDLSNVDDALAKFADGDLRRRITDNAFDMARERLTFSRLLDRFEDALRPLLAV